MHLADFRVGSLGETSIVGSGLPIATGAALGSHLLGSDRVSLCFFGDGASNEGTFHESLNVAAVWNLPVVFLCENNLYAVTTPASKYTAVANIADRAAAYSMPGAIVDGQDVLAVYETVSGAVQRARKCHGPSLIEAKTYRFVEHAVNMGRVFNYRDAEEIELWKSRDPILLWRQRLTQEFGIAENCLSAIDEAARKEVNDAVEFARASPSPPLSEAYTDVFV